MTEKLIDRAHDADGVKWQGKMSQSISDVFKFLLGIQCAVCYDWSWDCVPPLQIRKKSRDYYRGEYKAYQILL